MSAERADAGVVSLQGQTSVAPASVEQALSGLWRQAVDSTGQGEHLSRAGLWNLIVYDPAPHGDRPGATDPTAPLQRLLDQVTLSVPSRILHLEAWPPAPRGDDAEIEAWVSARCLLTGAGNKQICVEEVTLAGFGEGGLSHFPSLVRATLLPDLPIAMLWLETIPHNGWLLEQLLQSCDRLLLDSQTGTRSTDLAEVYRIAQRGRARIVDLGWMRLNPVRYLLAALFDPPGRAEQLADLGGIRVVTTSVGRNTGLLLLGWLLARCGRDGFTGEAGQGAGSLAWRITGGGKPFTARLDVQEGEGGLDGLELVEIEAGGHRFSLRQLDAEHVALRSPDRQEDRLALHGWETPELVVAALGAQGLDRVYPEALATAAALIAAQPDAP